LAGLEKKLWWIYRKSALFNPAGPIIVERKGDETKEVGPKDDGRWEWGFRGPPMGGGVTRSASKAIWLGRSTSKPRAPSTY